MADVGEHERAAGALKQLLAELMLQGPNLAADGGLRQAQFFTGARDRALARDGPEVEQVVVIQPLHSAYDILFAFQRD